MADQEDIEQLPMSLRALAAELDELGMDEFSPSAPSPPEIPDFQIKSILGRGGMGTVFLAEQISLGREVALKVIPGGSGDPRPGAAADEARTVARLHPPNIVEVHAAGMADGQSWFAMELMRGESADRHSFASVKDAAGIGVQVAEALSYSHRCGVIHRDVKPSNIFIGDNGFAKLGDFGLACLAGGNASGRSGTRRYMAPELLEGGAASESSDQYALGVTLRELAGKTQASAAATDAQGLVPPDDGNGKHIPSDLAAICDKATAQDPADRYENMEAMLDDLHRFLAHKPVAANPPSPVRRFRLFVRRNPLAASGLVAAVLLLACLMAALIVGYVQTSRALAATRREAAESARSLATALAAVNREEPDPRDAELRRALELAKALAERFPDDETIQSSVKTLEKAREAHLRLRARPRRRPRPNMDSGK